MMAVSKRYREVANTSERERWMSLVGSGALLAYGLTRRDKGGLGLAALGGALVCRGATGHSYLYQFLGIHTDHRQGASIGVPYELGIRVDDEVTIEAPVHEVYRFWRDLNNLPR